MMASSLALSVLMGDSKRYVEYYEYTDENLALYENLLTLEHVEHYICRDLTLEVQNYIWIVCWFFEYNKLLNIAIL